MTIEEKRRLENTEKDGQWLFWGPYVSERQWGTVREDYSENGDAWGYFPHDHARSRAYRWGEDGLAGISDRYQRLCFAIALWNGHDPILKERLFGLTGPEGNHGEDVKEYYYYLDNTPTHSYMRYLYKYPHAAFPYDELVAENRSRDKKRPEYELADTGLISDGEYFDVEVEYAKGDWNDILIRIHIHNRGSKTAPCTLLPCLWFRNRWTFGQKQSKPSVSWLEDKQGHSLLKAGRPSLGEYYFACETADHLFFTENESNQKRLFDRPNPHPYVKDLFHEAIVDADYSLPTARQTGSKFSPVYHWDIPAGQSRTVQCRLWEGASIAHPLGPDFSELFSKRKSEADAFYQEKLGANQAKELANIQRQALAGMLWTKQYYYIDIPTWLEGDDPTHPPPASRKHGRNHEWSHLNNNDIISMPDKWEYPWYAAWDLAFHCIPLAMVDPDFAKKQLILMLREWYMAPNGQIPAYEWNFSDVNPPVHAWASMQVYLMEKKQQGSGDISFLKRVFQKLMINFTWWVNQKDANGNNVFEGGFLGLDNIGVFDRSSEIPGGGHLEQADGSAWMATYALNLMEMALEISLVDPDFEDVATKFFEHFTLIAHALNHRGQKDFALWDEKEGLYFDLLILPGGEEEMIRVRSLVGLAPMFAVSIVRKEQQQKLKDFMRRMSWFRRHKLKDEEMTMLAQETENEDILLSIVSPKKLRRVLHAMLDEKEFLSPYGIRSLSKIHEKIPYKMQVNEQVYSIRYQPGESDTNMFGGNSNWRGPVWFPMNYMLIEALMTYHDYLGDDFRVAFPTGSRNMLNLAEVAREISLRLIKLFEKDKNGKRPVYPKKDFHHRDPYSQDLILFYEYFHGDNGRGVGASHQTGWTGLVANLIDRFA